MSGIGKAIKKVFKAVAKVAKVIVPIALVAGAAIVTGGLAAPAAAGAAAAGSGAAAAGAGTLAAGAGAGAASTIGATGSLLAGGAAAAGTAAPLAGAAAGAGLASGGVGGWLASTASSLGSSLLNSGTVGKVISGAAQGFMQHQSMKAEEDMRIDAEKRQAAKYKGAGDAGSFDFSATGQKPRGLGADMDDPAANESETQLGSLGSDTLPTGGQPQGATSQSTALASKAKGPRKPRYSYNPQSGRIEFA